MMKKIWLTDADMELFRTEKGFKIGTNCHISPKTYLDAHGELEIGNNVTITSFVKILTHDASKARLGKKKHGKTIIGNNVFVGLASIILMDVKIGDNSIIGAGAVVTKDVPVNEVWAGNPAKKIGVVP